jgi:hypothetical protein
LQCFSSVGPIEPYDKSGGDSNLEEVVEEPTKLHVGHDSVHTSLTENYFCNCQCSLVVVMSILIVLINMATGYIAYI